MDKRIAFGGVVFDENGRILLMKPKNEFAGYKWTFPKGRPKGKEGAQKVALRKVFEKTGVKAKIIANVPGEYDGTVTRNGYFAMKAISCGAPFGDQTENIRWATISETRNLIEETTNIEGKRRDIYVLNATLSRLHVLAEESLNVLNPWSAELAKTVHDALCGVLKNCVPMIYASGTSPYLRYWSPSGDLFHFLLSAETTGRLRVKKKIKLKEWLTDHAITVFHEPKWDSLLIDSEQVAQVFTERLPQILHPFIPASRDSWQTKRMPDRKRRLQLERSFSLREYDRLRYGYVPQEMEDKWFIFLEDNWLNFHRSWTGICIYRVRLDRVKDRYECLEAWANRDPREYSMTNDAYDASLLEFLIDSDLLHKKHASFPCREDFLTSDAGTKRGVQPLPPGCVARPMEKLIPTLFRERPNSWGLRGDPYLWEEMEHYFAGHTIPETADELMATIQAVFEQLTGVPIFSRESFYVERFSHGGMSGGHVDPQFWREVALPLLRARYAEMRQGTSALTSK